MQVAYLVDSVYEEVYSHSVDQEAQFRLRSHLQMELYRGPELEQISYQSYESNSSE